MGRHSTRELPPPWPPFPPRPVDVPPVPLPDPLLPEPALPSRGTLIVVGMLCTTAVVAVLALSGAAETLGRIVCALAVGYAAFVWHRHKQRRKLPHQDICDQRHTLTKR